MKPARVNTKQKLEALVERMREQERRVRLVEAGETATPAAAAAPAAPAPASTPVTQAAPPSKQINNDTAETTTVTVQSVAEQLNAIRAGKSLKDTLVQQELGRYFDGLETSEQEALHAYLKGLAQIVSGQIEAGQAEEPSNHGVEMKAVGKKTRTIKPNVINKQSAKPTPKTGAPLGAPKEDTTPPSTGPIVPKKR